MINNIILIGFMFSGKSSIGKMLAENLGYNFIDTDNLIEEKENRAIKNIFTQDGESYFRKLEEEIIYNLKNIKNTVIAVGGGAVLNFNNIQQLKSIGRVFYLNANLNTILQRAKNKDQRPLANGNLTELYYFRKPIYESLGEIVHVDHGDKKKTVQDILARISTDVYPLLSVNKQKIFFTKKFYQVFQYLGFSEKKYIIITDDNVINCLNNNFYDDNNYLGLIKIKNGEKYKNLNTVNYIYDELFCLKAHRQTIIVAIGGGVVLDLAGFCASTYMRGLNLINIPTSLLAMVDASLGGKTGYDHENGKNLIGNFYEASAIIIDEEMLGTLPKDEFSCGMAEIIKHAILDKENLFYELLNNKLSTREIIEKSIKIKANILRIDFKEKNVRAHLNLGHTFAHAIEKSSKYKIKHGQAVAIGLVLAGKLSQKIGILENNFLPDLIKLLKKYDLPTELPSDINIGDLKEHIQYDKKQDNAGVRFILPMDIGKICIKTLPISLLD